MGDMFGHAAKVVQLIRLHKLMISFLSPKCGSAFSVCSQNGRHINFHEMNS